MFRKTSGEDYTDFELNNYVIPHFDTITNYFKKYVIPDACAFVIYSAYKNNIEENSFHIFINDGLTHFNFEYSKREINKMKKEVSEILRIKYGLKVINDDPLMLEETFNQVMEMTNNAN